uniref:RNase H type-1 domain-containing protein n=1 Tax=Brassica oleracea var. oleracea TaxID=109376 RepID=A0A0D3D6W7_BRAOL
MRCDNYCPRCGETEESVTHAIFECPPALQARNDKLFRGIERDPLELVRHAESECQAWFNANEMIAPLGQANSNEVKQALSLALHSEVEALRRAMENMLQHSPCQSFGIDCKEQITMIKEPQEWPSFATELEKIETLRICFPDFKIIHVPRARNQSSDFLAKTARTFRRELLFIGCSIPVWLSRPPQV